MIAAKRLRLRAGEGATIAGVDAITEEATFAKALGISLRPGVHTLRTILGVREGQQRAGRPEAATTYQYNERMEELMEALKSAKELVASWGLPSRSRQRNERIPRPRRGHGHRHPRILNAPYPE